jgi:hypothetical protein
MFIYNITMKVEQSIHSEWLNWMKMEHLPEVLATGCFSSHRLLKVLDLDETDGMTFALQLMTEKRSSYTNYISQFAAEIQKKSWQKWGQRLLSFSTLMESVD